MLASFTPNFIATGNAFMSDRGEVDAEYFDLSLGAGGSFVFRGGATLSLTGLVGGLA